MSYFLNLKLYIIIYREESIKLSAISNVLAIKFN